MTTESRWEAFAEPCRTTLLRTGSIALAVGFAVGIAVRRLAVVPQTTLVALWFTLGGHFVDLLFRNHLRQRISGEASVQTIARLLYWYAGGMALYACALATRAMLSGRSDAPWPWWTGGLLFVGLELLVHLLLRARKLPCFYDGRG